MSFEVPYENYMDCAFCGNPDNKARLIIENELAWSFPSNMPIVPGHTLVIPKRHVARFHDMTPEELQAVFDLTYKLQQAMTKAFKAHGFNVAFNQGERAGQSVPHFHLHIVPRYQGDAGITEFEPRKFLYRPGDRKLTPQEELEKIASLIREAA